MAIQGLRYKKNFITQAMSDWIMSEIDKEKWSTQLKRRTQHYGWRYDYTTRKVDDTNFIGWLPDWADVVAKLLFESHYFYEVPTQVIVNEYMAGQGIGLHVDCEPCFGNTVASISLLSPVELDFVNRNDPDYPKDKKYSFVLEPLSLLTMSGHARFFWKHGIAPRMTDTINGVTVPRQRRISLTFRTVISDPALQIDDELIFAQRAEGGTLGISTGTK